MKRLPLVLASLLLVLASCSQAGKGRPQLGLAMRSLDDSFSAAIRKSLETQALDKADLAIVDGQNQQPAQDMQVGSLFQRGLGALAVDPVDALALGAIIGSAKARRVPIVFFDRRPTDEAMRSWDKLFFVGSREADGGAALAAILASHWKANPGDDRNKDGKVQILALGPDQDGPEMAALVGAFVKALEDEGIQSDLLDPEGQGGQSGGVPALVAKYGERAEALLSGDPGSTLAAIEALKSAGYSKARKGIPVVGLGEGRPSAAIAEAIKAGTLLGAACVDLEGQGKAVFDLAYALARGRDPSKAGWRIDDVKFVWIPYKKYTSLSLLMTSQ
jgi:methyl-galactoside transport system substrate-binding protein